jgi:hypothetical protein
VAEGDAAEQIPPAGSVADLPDLATSATWAAKLTHTFFSSSHVKTAWRLLSSIQLPGGLQKWRFRALFASTPLLFGSVRYLLEALAAKIGLVRRVLAQRRTIKRIF